MSTTTIQFTFTVDGVSTDATSVLLRDPTGTFGLRRTDTLATVAAPGVPMIRDSTGHYSYAFSDPSPGLSYNYWVEVAFDGATYRFERNRSAEAIAASIAYLDAAVADGLAAELPPLAGWAAATADAKTRALFQASADVDSAMPYQGRRYALEQPLEFPRVAYEAFSFAARTSFAASVPENVWEWSVDANNAVVPHSVLLAVLYQADSILLDKRAARIDAQHDGVVYELTGTLAESYKESLGPGARSGLCRRAWTLMRNYRRRSGVLL